MPDYSKGKIYTIRCRNDDTLIYVGSTIQSLAKRWGQHKTKSSIHPNRLIYQKINNDWENWYIELYEEYSCENREQLCKKEGDIIRSIATLNKKVEGRTHKEYYIDNADKITEQRKQYYMDNKEKLNEQQKQYYIDNIDKIAEKHKLYRVDNAEKLKENARQPFECECSSTCRVGHKARHFKTKKHLNYLQNQENKNHII